ncbi:hypothetical protein JOB18_010776 [Solea senegalensis]|uniref:Uncharacterized protein n=1 Tax=Solea senegalensis TaxID=28829 RepID=A0AAV6QVN3_SOLSE|nr:hypothetical protein JOB18_010776 [Solea senegalensis]
MSTALIVFPASGSGFHVWQQDDPGGLHEEVVPVVFLIVILSLRACVPLPLIDIWPRSPTCKPPLRLRARAFHVPFMCPLGRGESEAKVEAPACIGKAEENTPGRCGTPSLPGRGPRGDQCRRFDVVFESPASPTVLYQLSLPGNMSGPYLRGERKRKQREHLQTFADRLESKGNCKILNANKAVTRRESDAKPQTDS